MALAATFDATREDWATITATPQARGLMLLEQQTDVVILTKLTGDTAGSIDLTGVQNITGVYLFAINDSAGSAVTDLTLVAPTYTVTDFNTIAFTGLGDWTRAVAFVLGRNYD